MADDSHGPDALPPLREVIARYGIGARRSLGQHFLLDLNITRCIARESGDLTGQTVIEIGPGPGGLTRALLESGAHEIIAIERDARAVEALSILREAYPGRFTVLEEDAMTVSLSTLGDSGRPRTVIANLPYNIAQRLLLGWLKEIGSVQSLTLMLRAALRTLSKTPLELLEQAGIDPTVRAETLEVEQFCALAQAFDASQGVTGDAQ